MQKVTVDLKPAVQLDPEHDLQLVQPIVTLAPEPQPEIGKDPGEEGVQTQTNTFNSSTFNPNPRELDVRPHPEANPLRGGLDVSIGNLFNSLKPPQFDPLHTTEAYTQNIPTSSQDVVTQSSADANVFFSSQSAVETQQRSEAPLSQTPMQISLEESHPQVNQAPSYLKYESSPSQLPNPEIQNTKSLGNSPQDVTSDLKQVPQLQESPVFFQKELLIEREPAVTASPDPMQAQQVNQKQNSTTDLKPILEQTSPLTVQEDANKATFIPPNSSTPVVETASQSPVLSPMPQPVKLQTYSKVHSSMDTFLFWMTSVVFLLTVGFLSYVLLIYFSK